MILSYGKTKSNKPKVIMVSGEAGKKFQQKILDEGADAFFTKPLNVEMLKEFIKTLQF